MLAGLSDSFEISQRSRRAPRGHTVVFCAEGLPAGGQAGIRGDPGISARVSTISHHTLVDLNVTVVYRKPSFEPREVRLIHFHGPIDELLRGLGLPQLQVSRLVREFPS